jgi:nucleotide-binding universal stress UspA family protein
MFRTILVPLDGSALAERALPYAVRLASASGARVALVQVVPVVTSFAYEWAPQPELDLEEAQAYLEAVANGLESRVPVATRAVYGDTHHAIREAATTYTADAIVMATHGRTGLNHLVNGSVAEAVLSDSPIPVFLVLEGPGQLPPRTFDPVAARIIVPLDGSDFAETALPIAREMLGAAGELVLVNVVPVPDRAGSRAYLDEEATALGRDADSYLHKVAASLTAREPDLHVAVDIRVCEEAAQGIAAAVIDRGADLVVMSTRGRTGLGRAVLGSVAGEVLRAVAQPVVLVGPAAARAAVQPAPVLSATG